jgi:AcrR family transcriptional regulator
MVYAEGGIDAPLDETARRAGVGNATLYRRFPTRAALLAAVFEERLAEYACAAQEALLQPDTWAGFCQYAERISQMQAADWGVSDVLTMTLPSAPGWRPSMSERPAHSQSWSGGLRRRGNSGRISLPRTSRWLLPVVNDGQCGRGARHWRPRDSGPKAVPGDRVRRLPRRALPCAATPADGCKVACGDARAHPNDAG